MNLNMGKQIKSSRATRAVATSLLLLLVVAFSSCAKETTDGEHPLPKGKSIAVHITFPKSEQPQVADAVARSNTFAKAKASSIATRATDPGTEAERQIDRMAILVFNADGTTLESVLDIDLSSANTSLPDEQPQWKINKTLVLKDVTDLETPKMIYAVANWNKTDFDKATYTEAMLKDELSTIVTVDELATPLLMSSSNSVDFSTSGSKVTVELQRQVAKLNIALTVDTETQEALPNIQWLTDKAKIMAGNIPDKSYVVGRTPFTFPADYTLLASELVPMTVVSASGDLKLSHSIYVHENPVTGTEVTNKGKATYVVIQLPYHNSTTNTDLYDNYYKVYVDNTLDTENPYQVLRNTIYNFNLKVMGLGLPLAEINTKSSPQRSTLATSQMRMQSMFQGIIGGVDVISLSGADNR